MEKGPRIKAKENTTKTDTVIEDLGNQKAREKIQVKVETEEKEEAEERENRSTAPVTTVGRQDTWHETASADKRTDTSRSSKTNKAQN